MDGICATGGGPEKMSSALTFVASGGGFAAGINMVIFTGVAAGSDGIIVFGVDMG